MLCFQSLKSIESIQPSQSYKSRPTKTYILIRLNFLSMMLNIECPPIYVLLRPSRIESMEDHPLRIADEC